MVPISPRWNYLRGLMSLPAFAEIDPAIVHFAAPPKPWTGDLPPWGREGYAPYVEMHRKLEALHLPWQRLSLWRKLKWLMKWWLKPQFADKAIAPACRRCCVRMRLRRKTSRPAGR